MKKSIPLIFQFTCSRAYFSTTDVEGVGFNKFRIEKNIFIVIVTCTTKLSETLQSVQK